MQQQYPYSQSGYASGQSESRHGSPAKSMNQIMMDPNTGQVHHYQMAAPLHMQAQEMDPRVVFQQPYSIAQYHPSHHGHLLHHQQQQLQHVSNMGPQIGQGHFSPSHHQQQLMHTMQPLQPSLHYSDQGASHYMSYAISPTHFHPATGYHGHHVHSGSPASPPPGQPCPQSASLFSRAAQKMGKKSKRKHQPPEPEPPPLPTHFHQIVRQSPPPAPPCLLKVTGRPPNPSACKVKVMLKISPTMGHHGDQASSCLSIDPRKKQVTVYDGAAGTFATPSHRRANAPKMFAFDAVFSPDDSQTELCSSSLTDIIEGVVSGSDGCIFTYGYSKVGKSYTMIGKDTSTQTLGLIPCAITWLFRLIDEQKGKTGARFSVRVSAVEVSGKQETLRDLLCDVAQGVELGSGSAPGVYLREDPICGTQLENQSELRAPTADKATYYLDAALAARAKLSEEETRSAHLLFTLHVYQYRIEKPNQVGLPGVAGGRSRLHLIDLGSSSKSKDPDNVSLSLSALGSVIMALLNGQRHVPHRDSKVAQLLRDSLGNISCRTCMVAHVSPAVPHYNETLQVIQLAARIHRMKRRKVKFSSTSSDDSSTDDGHMHTRPLRGFRMGTLREDVVLTTPHSDPDYTSSSEQSCDTVIYIGAHGQSLSDRELTDHEGPPRSVPRTNPRLPRRPSGSRSSGDEGSNSDSGRSQRSNYSAGKQSLNSLREYAKNVRVPIRTQPIIHRNLPCSNTNNREPVCSPPMSPKVGHIPQKANIRTRLSNRYPDETTVSIAKADKVSVSKSVATVSAKVASGEQEILKNEQWIDGPSAPPYPEKPRSAEQWVDGPQAFIVKHEQPKNKHLYNPKMNAEEQWVDGPKEMVTDENKSKSRKHSSGGTKSRSREHSLEPAGPSSGPKPKAKSKSPERQEGKEVRPFGTESIDSNSSLLAHAPDSRPTSMHSSTDIQPEDPSQVKPFVRDWVEKHRTLSGTDQDGEIPVDTSKRHKSDLAKRVKSSTPKNSPSPGRKGDSCSNSPNKLEKSQLPSSTCSSKRVTEWLRSVSLEQEDAPEAVLPSELPPSATEVSSTCSVLDDSLPNGGSSEQSLSQCSIDGRPDEMAECNIADISFDSSVDTGEIDTNLGMNNRESIYELQMDEQLEKNSRNNQDMPDDETFSNTSYSKEKEDQGISEETLLLIKRGVSQSVTLESIKTLIAEPLGEDKEEEEDEDNTYEPIFDVKVPLLSNKFEKTNDKVHPNINQLLRKPDGASNPNLHSELDFEQVLDKNILRAEYFLPGQDTNFQVHHVMTDYQTPKSHLYSDIPKDSCSTKSNHTKSKPPLPSRNTPKSSLQNSFNVSPAKSNVSSVSASPKSVSSSAYSSASTPGGSVGTLTRSQDKEKYRNQVSSSSSSIKSNSGNNSPGIHGISPKVGKQTAISSKLPVFGGKSGGCKDIKSRKEKDSKVNKVRINDIHHSSGRGNDSDSGNDSGIVAHERKLLSPYSTVTKPRTPSHSSSGHGSDNSSTFSAELRSQLELKSEKLHGGTSSGYESMLRDSEGTVTSSAHEDSSSESSEKKKGARKKRSSKRSRSVPSRSSESSDSKRQSPCGTLKMANPSSKVKLDSRQIQKICEENNEKSENMQRQKMDENGYEPSDYCHDAATRTQLIEHQEAKNTVETSSRGWDCRFLMCFSCRSRSKQTDV